MAQSAMQSCVQEIRLEITEIYFDIHAASGKIQRSAWHDCAVGIRRSVDDGCGLMWIDTLLFGYESVSLSVP